ncbi:homoserine kinase [Buchnera aphidicola]|uniref:homoserine kinase n=1 Tax=Buchnera aphidicola TaxID=9 RepID=UPI0022376FC4|nr:homoserine kinase [Buchnera aphidicola]MCW5197729.1 homoserine kinase [Buchnera aphidicola (Chaitophorus viminalis)]
MIKIYAPASIGNLSVGFDILGAAIVPIQKKYLGDIVTIQFSKNFQLTNIGKFSQELPKSIYDNLTWKAWKIFCKTIKKKKNVHIILEKNLPISSGLGSSASSIVATLVALNTLFKKPLKKKKLIQLMGILEKDVSNEKHYDNVIPSYLGGIRLIIKKQNCISQNLPYFKNWFWVISWPGTKLSTSKSRSVLPNSYSKKDCIENSKNLSCFIHALHSKKSDLAASFMHDVIAEPYRKKLLKNFSLHKKNVKKIGSIAYGISGSGPTIFSICDNETTAEEVKKYFLKNYIQNKKGFSYICQIDSIGARKIGKKSDEII